MPVDEKHSMKFCGICGKIQRSGRKGTMTSWIFGGNGCNCDNGSDKHDFGAADGYEGENSDGFQFPVRSAQAPGTDTPLPDLGERFEILEFLGEGGMGAVYKIRERETQKFYAAKVLKKDMAGDPNAIRRFELEVRAASELTHPNLVFVYGSYRTRDGAPYMVMNFVDGISLNESLKFHNTLPYKRAVSVFIQVAEALAHAHSKRIVHRDLKPSNILIYQHESQRDAVRLVDFGIAKMINQDIKNTGSLTQTGELFGSPLYMSPEQCSGDSLDARSDIYSLGCVMYHTLCGQPPFNDANAMKTMIGHMQTPPQPLRLVNKTLGVPKDLERIVMRCLEKDPDKRYQHAMAVADDLRAIQDGKSISKIDSSSKVDFAKWRMALIVAGSFLLGTICAVGATLLFVYHPERGSEQSMRQLPDLPIERAAKRSSPIKVHDSESDFSRNGEEAILNSVDRSADSTKPVDESRGGSGSPAGQNAERAGAENKNNIFIPNISAKDLITHSKKTRSPEMKIVWADNPDLLLLKDLPYLQSLQLAEGTFTAKGLEYLVGDPIQSMVLTRCTVESLQSLKELPLKILRLEQMRLTPTIAADIASLRSVQRLTLAYSPISDESFGKLTAMPNLRSLKLDHEHLGHDGWRYLSQMRNLSDVYIDDYKFTDDCMANFHSLPLSVLTISNAKISGLGVMYLSRSQSLKILKFVDCANINDTAINYLRSKMPTCVITLVSNSTSRKRQTPPGLSADGRSSSLEKVGLPASANFDVTSNSADTEDFSRFKTDAPIMVVPARTTILSTISHRAKTLDLSFGSSLVQDSDMRLIATAPMIRSIYIDAEALTQKGLDELAGSSIDSVHLVNARFQNLKVFAKMPRLINLFLDSSELNAEATSDITSLNQLRDLRLKDVQLTDAELIGVSKMNVNWLSITDCNSITEAGLQDIPSMKRLKTLVLRNCDHITAAAAERLRQRLTRCNFTYQASDKPFTHSRDFRMQ